MDRLLRVSIRVYGSKAMLILRDTLKVMFPIMLLGSFAEVIKAAFLTPTGFMATLFNITKWLPFHRDLAWSMGVIFHCTIDMIALYGAFGAAYYTAKVYGRKSAAAGVAGLLSFLIISYQPNSSGMPDFNPRLMSEGMLLSLIVGYLCGRIMVKLVNVKKDELFQLIKPVSIIIIFSAIVNMILGLIGRFEIPTYVASFVSQHTQINALFYVLGMGVLTNLLSWMAFGGPFTNSPTFGDSVSLSNMNAALKAGSSWNVPFKFTDTTLYHSFANFGGTGVVLALIIAILIFSKKVNNRKVSKWAIFPAIFNNNYAMMLGIPILFNPILLIPFLLAPLVNMILAAILLALHWIPAAAYPVPAGTPGPLIAFIGTNGNWLALIFGAFLICLDVLIYMPFVKLADQVVEKAGDDDEEI
ncbi:PTS transporter subunit EIIC [Companilactobacillus huachuanensis]|uniref:Permease IIC component n=1 Tax=Companilactobacillus huachuanensis TaxID=2559914 RepID=A0ABW1RNS5_9LACO|nr:PTS transporter subunit EIIC [Companilactobacillus huachuanensis]